MEGALLLNVVVRESPAVLQLLAGEDQSLLVRRNAFLVLQIKMLTVGQALLDWEESIYCIPFTST